MIRLTFLSDFHRGYVLLRQAFCEGEGHQEELHQLCHLPEGSVVAEVLTVLLGGDGLVDGVNRLQNLAPLPAVQAESEKYVAWFASQIF